MDGSVTITEESADPEFTRRMAQFSRNGDWLSAQGLPLLERYAGKYLAVSEGEVFASDDAEEAERLARNAHPDDEPFVQYLPRERAERIYAG
jgi:hypothetical protein